MVTPSTRPDLRDLVPRFLERKRSRTRAQDLRRTCSATLGPRCAGLASRLAEIDKRTIAKHLDDRFCEEHRLDCLDGFGVNAVFFIWFFRKEIFSARTRLHADPQWLQQQVDTLNPGEAIHDRRLFVVGLIACSMS